MPFDPGAGTSTKRRTFAVPFLIAETVVFAGASLMHSGWFGKDLAHADAATGEGLIALLCLAGLAVVTVIPSSARFVAIAVQFIALLGTLLGTGMIAIGIGPHSVPDIGLHVAMLALLFFGLSRARSS